MFATIAGIRSNARVKILRVESMNCGYCLHPEFVTKKGGTYGSIQFPSTVILMDHPTQGVVLFDTGYTDSFFEQTRQFPESLYAKVTPVVIDDTRTAVSQLQARGIHPTDVRHIIISHFHADHIAGAKDFPQAKFHFSFDALAPLRARSRVGRILGGFLPGLLPVDFDHRSIILSSDQFCMHPTGLSVFKYGYDLFGDQRIFLIPLPGHAPGHIGILTRLSSGDAFFIGDASWSEDNFKLKKPPMRAAVGLLGDWTEYSRTLDLLGQCFESNPEVSLIPCHCTKSHARFSKQQSAETKIV